jgi:hypothetical protein
MVKVKYEHRVISMIILCYVRATKQETHGRMRCYKVCAMVQAVGRRPVIAEARVRLQSRPCEICGEQSGNGMFFFPPTTSVFPYRYHTTNTPYLSYMSLLPEGQMGEASEPSKKQLSFGNRRQLDGKALSRF